MNQALTNHKSLTPLSLACWLLFFISFICSLRAISSISTGLLVVAGLWENRTDIRGFFSRAFTNPFFISCTLFYLLQFIALLYTDNIHEGWGNIRLKAGLLFIPLALCGMDPLNDKTRKNLFSYFCVLLAAALMYCVIVNFSRYEHWHYKTIFFYHALVKPLSQHAVYFSIYVLAALIFLLEHIKKGSIVFHKAVHIFLIVYFSVFLVLLSSKLVIAFYALYLLYFFISLLKKNRKNNTPLLILFILLIIAGASVLAIKNPVSNRYYEILHGNMKLINQEKFDRGDYFNGVQFRALQWKFTPAILNHTHRWVIGVSPGDAQFYLDQQYITRNMYTGDPATGSHGFLGYNTHNQFLQSLLQTGIMGLILFGLIIFYLIKMAWKSDDNINIFLIILLIIYSLTESLFQTQYGILLLTFFPLFTRPGISSKQTSE